VAAAEARSHTKYDLFNSPKFQHTLLGVTLRTDPRLGGKLLEEVTSDGLNHQACALFQVDGSTLEVRPEFGMKAASSHSWSNTVIVRDEGDFLGLDLGDNYPRGANVHLIGASSKSSKVVYTFKTKHSSGWCSGDDVYYVGEDGSSYCKQSNDNKVYTEIGHPGLVEVDDGLLVFFAGEQDPLDNSKIGASLNAPRDLGFVKVSKDLKTVLSGNNREEGGFYNYGGGWSKQVNQGVNFLTAFPSKDESVSRLKTFDLTGGRILLTYEIWTGSSYVRTEFMELNAVGDVVRHVSVVCFAMRLAIADDALVKGDKAVAYAGTRDGSLARYEICLGESCEGPDGGALPPPTQDNCPVDLPGSTMTTPATAKAATTTEAAQEEGTTTPSAQHPATTERAGGSVTPPATTAGGSGTPPATEAKPDFFTLKFLVMGVDYESLAADDPAQGAFMARMVDEVRTMLAAELPGSAYVSGAAIAAEGGARITMMISVPSGADISPAKSATESVAFSEALQTALSSMSSMAPYLDKNSTIAVDDVGVEIDASGNEPMDADVAAGPKAALVALVIAVWSFCSTS